MKTIIIHGHTNKGLCLSQDSIDRCSIALDYFKKTKVDKIICSGGLFDGNQLGVKNSHAFKVWLLSKGVPSEIIVEEDQSVTTIDNVERVSQILRPEEKVYVITSNYHLIRTSLIWKLFGKKEVVFLSAKSKVTLKKVIVEVVGILVVLCWFVGFKFPEIYFRKKSRNQNNSCNKNPA